MSNLTGKPICEPAEPDPVAVRLLAIERIGDAVIRWVVTIIFTLCGAAVAAAYVAQYLAGK